MKKYLATCLLLISSTVFADIDCYRSLLKDHWDSSHFRVHVSEIDINENEMLDEPAVANALNVIYKKLNCPVEAKKAQVNCANVLKTKICRHDMQYGYFLVSMDYLGTMNIIFNRWD